jgi:hypothetical protein
VRRVVGGVWNGICGCGGRGAGAKRAARIDDKGRLKSPRLPLLASKSKYGRELFRTSLTGEYVRVNPMPAWLRARGRSSEPCLTTTSRQSARLSTLDRGRTPTDTASVQYARTPSNSVSPGTHDATNPTHTPGSLSSNRRPDEMASDVDVLGHSTIHHSGIHDSSQRNCATTRQTKQFTDEMRALQHTQSRIRYLYVYLSRASARVAGTHTHTHILVHLTAHAPPTITRGCSRNGALSWRVCAWRESIAALVRACECTSEGVRV